jgi:uncharacterized damage-inducible protein DinB
MSIAQSLLPEFDHEMAATRKMLEVVPEGRSDWKPHDKSMTLGRLAGHVAELPGWGKVALEQTELDFAPVGAPAFKPGIFTTRAETLKAFDDAVAATRAALMKASDADLMVIWTLKSGGNTLLSMPRVAVLRSFMMNHIVHHRAQLGVYLRLNDVAIPGPYGPSADEKEAMRG